jgi:superfamily II DNA or RNA helicase
VKAKITIVGQYSVLEGDFPVLDVREACSYAVDGARFTKAFKKGLWDGRVHLFKHKTGKFPTGLIGVVTDVLDKDEIPYDVVDEREEPEIQGGGFELLGVKMEGKYSYQMDVCKAMIEAKQGVVKVATNGGKTAVSAAVTNYIGRKTLFIVTTKDLLYQGRRQFQQYLGEDEREIGICGDGIWSPGNWITIATMDTLVSKLKQDKCQKLLKDAQVVFIDEAHHGGSDTWFNVLEQCPAFYRFAMSGTPLDRTDGADMRLIGNTGELIVEITNKQLVESGVSANAQIVWDKVAHPVISKSTPYPTVYKNGIVRNDDLLKKVVDWTKVFYELGLSTLILAEELEQGRRIDDALWNDTDGMFIPHQFIHGKEHSKVRSGALVDLSERNLPVLIASRILDEGVDVPSIDALICAGSRKSHIKTMQRLGRGLRGDKLIVVEFSNFCHKFLLEHSLQRYEDYQKEECFPIHTSSPDIDFVRDLWHNM